MRKKARPGVLSTSSADDDEDDCCTAACTACRDADIRRKTAADRVPGSAGRTEDAEENSRGKRGRAIAARSPLVADGWRNTLFQMTGMKSVMNCKDHYIKYCNYQNNEVQA